MIRMPLCKKSRAQSAAFVQTEKETGSDEVPRGGRGNRSRCLPAAAGGPWAQRRAKVAKVESPVRSEERFDATRSAGVAFAACGSDLRKKIPEGIGANARAQSPSLPGDVGCILRITVFHSFGTRRIESRVDGGRRADEVDVGKRIAMVGGRGQVGANERRIAVRSGLGVVL